MHILFLLFETSQGGIQGTREKTASTLGSKPLFLLSELVSKQKQKTCPNHVREIFAAFNL